MERAGLREVVEVVQGGIRVEGDRTRGRDLSGERGRGTGRGRGRDSSGGHEEGQVGGVEGCKEKMVEEEKGIGESNAVQRNVSIIQSEELCILELTMSSLASFPGLHIQYSM